jgi:hypothetical protein
VRPSALPILYEFRLVNSCPFKDQALGAARQVSPDDSDRINAHDCSIITVRHVDMRRLVIVVIHGGDYPVELTYPGHQLGSVATFTDARCRVVADTVAGLTRIGLAPDGRVARLGRTVVFIGEANPRS